MNGTGAVAGCDVGAEIAAGQPACRGDSQSTGLPNLGNNRAEFASQFLVPALRKTQVVYEELWEDVFGSSLTLDAVDSPT